MTKYLLNILLPVILGVTAMPVSADVLRDPTRPPDVNEGDKSSPSSAKRVAPELNAIIISAQQKVAVVNNIIVREGDDVNGYQVISIQPGKIELQGPSGIIQLLLPAKSVKG